MIVQENLNLKLKNIYICHDFSTAAHVTFFYLINNKMEEDFQSPIYLIEIAETCPESSLEYLKTCLVSSKLIIADEKFTGHRVLSVKCTFSDLCNQVSRVSHSPPLVCAL